MANKYNTKPMQIKIPTFDRLTDMKYELIGKLKKDMSYTDVIDHLLNQAETEASR